MGLFKKEKATAKEYSKSIRLFKDSVKEIDELYDDLKAEYAAIETVVTEFDELVHDMGSRLAEADRAALYEFATRLAKVNSCARNSVRDIRDVLRNHKKRLNEMKNDT